MPEQDKDLVQLFVRDLDRIELPPRGRWRPAPRKESPLMRSGRSLLYASAVAAVLVLALVAGLGLRDGRDVAQSPTPTPSSSAPLLATASPTSPTPSVSPSPAGGRYVSALLGYSLELPAPWHRSICNGAVTQQTPVPHGEVFHGVDPRDTGGFPHPALQVFAEPNPESLNPRQWAESGRSGGEVGQQIEDVTYAGRAAARRSAPGRLPTYFVQQRDRMYVVGPGPFTPRVPDQHTEVMVGIIESFRFITDAEQAVARTALPTARPPRTPEQVADGLAAAFAAKNVDALAELAAPCMVTFAEQGDGTNASREKYLDDLRAAFAAGLVVTVRPRPIEGDRAAQFPDLSIQSTWQDARGTAERKLRLIRGVNDRWEWHGTVERFGSSRAAAPAGAITGELGYPGDAGLPPFGIYAISVNDPRVFFAVRTPRYTPAEWREKFPSGRPTYTITGVSPGTYHVVGYVDSPDWPALVALWSRAAATCRGVSGTQCEQDDTLLPVTVRSGETVQGIHMYDWKPPPPNTPPRPR